MDTSVRPEAADTSTETGTVATGVEAPATGANGRVSRRSRRRGAGGRGLHCPAGDRRGGGRRGGRGVQLEGQLRDGLVLLVCVQLLEAQFRDVGSRSRGEPLAEYLG